MGLFTPGYIKEGKGVSKEEAGKRSYFGTIFEKFFDMMKINLLYIACNIPAIILCFLVAVPLFNMENIEALLGISKGYVLPVFWFLLPLLPLILTGPFTAGLTYITRNFVKREHSFLGSDFLEHTKKNIKQTLIANVIFYVVFCVYVTAFLFYIMKPDTSVLLMAVFLFIGLVLFSVPFYVYPMIVSFDMKLKDILKNAWIFALAKLPQNLVFLIIIAGVHGLLLYYVPVAWLVLMPLFLITWTSYTMNYYSWHVITKYMMPEDENKTETVFSDNIKEK